MKQLINVEFDLDGTMIAATLAVLALATEQGLESPGSGAGMGRRDVDIVGTPAQLAVFAKAVLALPALASLHATVSEPIDYEEDAQD